MSAVERAAEILARSYHRHVKREAWPITAAKMLAAADPPLLVTPEIQDVLDIVDTLPDGMLSPHQRGVIYAYLASRGEP